MSDTEAEAPRRTGREGLTHEERKSVTHGDFWIPEEEREKYKRALAALTHSRRMEERSSTTWSSGSCLWSSERKAPTLLRKMRCSSSNMVGR